LGALRPCVIDVRSAWAQLPNEARARAEAALGNGLSPTFAQWWALDLMDAMPT